MEPVAGAEPDAPGEPGAPSRRGTPSWTSTGSWRTSATGCRSWTGRPKDWDGFFDAAVDDPVLPEGAAVVAELAAARAHGGVGDRTPRAVPP